MTRDEIISMAEAANFDIMPPDQYHNESEVVDSGNLWITERLEHFAALCAAKEREKCSRQRAKKPRELSPVGTGALLGEQQFCFNKGWKEGAASVRSAIRARGNA